VKKETARANLYSKSYSDQNFEYICDANDESDNPWICAYCDFWSKENVTPFEATGPSQQQAPQYYKVKVIL